MKILLLSNLFPPHVVGGYERLCASIADSLAARGHEVHVLTSTFGGPVSGEDPFPVARALRLPVDERNIYAPLVLSSEERARLAARNVAIVEEHVRVVAPDVVLIGNLYFFDRSILTGLSAIARRCVHLLTDVWRIDFEEPSYVQDHFRRFTSGAIPRPTTLVARDSASPAVEWSDESKSIRERIGETAIERGRRRRIERELLDDSLVAQWSGECFLCGPTTFRFEASRTRSVLLPATSCPRTVCSRCDLDASIRAGLQLVELADPDVDEEELVVVCDSKSTERTLRASLGTSRVIVGPGDRTARARDARAALVVSAEPTLQRLVDLARCATLELAPGASLVVSTASRGGHADLSLSSELLGAIPNLGFHDARIGAMWSRDEGYVGRDETFVVARLSRG